jgi:hypothetical protein
MKRILLVGEDAHLLDTRAAILEQTGAAATCCPPSAITEHPEWEDFALVVLCHTIHDAKKLGEEIHRRWPEVPVLQVLTSYGAPSPINWHVDATSAATHPGDLVEVAKVLLRHSTEVLPCPAALG